MVVVDADTARGSGAARVLAAEGAAVVLVGADAAALGALAGELREVGARVAVFAGDVGDAASGDEDRDALAEMVAELFPDAAPGWPET